MTNRQPKVASIVLNWNDYPGTKRCLESLSSLRYGNHKIYLVDNNSADQSVSKLKTEFEEIEFIENDRNLGFAGGMNTGISAALDDGADYIWILNNDIVVPEEKTLHDLIERMEDNPTLGVLSPVIYCLSDPEERWFTQGLIKERSGGSTHHQDIANEDMMEGDLLYNDYIPFCAALFRGGVFEKTGYFPEEYFMYKEDVDYCLRLSNSGYRIATDLETSLFHEGTGSSGGRLGPTMLYYLFRNKLLLKYNTNLDICRACFLVSLMKLFCINLVLMMKNGTLVLKPILFGMIDGLLKKDGKGPYP